MERISQFTKTQEVGQKRKRLREILPADLQLEFVQERPGICSRKTRKGKVGFSRRVNEKKTFSNR